MNPSEVSWPALVEDPTARAGPLQTIDCLEEGVIYKNRIEQDRKRRTMLQTEYGASLVCLDRRSLPLNVPSLGLLCSPPNFGNMTIL